jgi:hypothetical protein
MNQLKALFSRLLLASVVSLFANAVCHAQTPTTTNPQSKPEKTTTAAAPDKDKPATTATTASALDEELAKTPAGKSVAKFFAAINSGDLKQMQAFHESTGGNVENADKDFDVYERTGGFKLHSLSPRDTKDKIAVLVQTKKDARWLTFEFTVGTQEPYPIMGINARPAEAPAAQTSH